MLAHLIEHFDVSLAITLSLKAGVSIILVDSLSIQICQPRFDVPCGDKQGHALIRSASLLTTFGRGIIDLRHTLLNPSTIRVDHHNQSLLNSVLSLAVIGKFLCKPSPHELFSRAATFRVDLYPLHSQTFACLCQKPPSERLMLPILAQDDDVDVTAHCSHPLAMTSDNFKPPSTAKSLDDRTTVAPELSRWSSNPRSPPR